MVVRFLAHHAKDLKLAGRRTYMVTRTRPTFRITETKNETGQKLWWLAGWAQGQIEHLQIPPFDFHDAG